MPKIAGELTALDVKRLTHSGDNQSHLFSIWSALGLYLQRTPKGGRSWVLRVKPGKTPVHGIATQDILARAATPMAGKDQNRARSARADRGDYRLG